MQVSAISLKFHFSKDAARCYFIGNVMLTNDITMDRTQLNVRISEGLAQELDKESDNTGRSKTWIVSAALSDYLDMPHEGKDIQLLAKRVEALERKFEDVGEKPEKIVDKPEGDLITIHQASQLTGYAVSSLRSKLSRSGVRAQKQTGGNRAGFYSKQEVLDKVGKK